MERTEATLDPKLRAAIKRVRGGHVANQMLRARVAQVLEQPAAASRSRSMVWLARIAVAACLVLAGGVAEHVRHKFEEKRNYAAANVALLAAMPKAHVAVLPAEAVAVSDITDPARVRDELSARLSRPVPTPDLRELKWDLTGASVTPLHGAIAARFDFAKGSRRATLFSLPRFALVGAKTGQTYDIFVDGHPITGFITTGGVHCIVGDSSMPLDELVALRKRLQQS